VHAARHDQTIHDALARRGRSGHARPPPPAAGLNVVKLPDQLREIERSDQDRAVRLTLADAVQASQGIGIRQRDLRCPTPTMIPRPVLATRGSHSSALRTLRLPPELIGPAGPVFAMLCLEPGL